MSTNSILCGTAEQRGKRVAFNRLRRITGYLTDDISRWNSAKQAEEHDQVKQL